MADMKALVSEIFATGRLAGLPSGHFIDGAFVGSLGGGMMETFDAGRGVAYAEFAAGTSDDVDRSVQSARAALEGWKRTRPAERGRILRAIADGLRAEADRFAVVEALDSGKRLSEAEGDAGSAARTFDYYAGGADKLCRTRRIRCLRSCSQAECSVSTGMPRTRMLRSWRRGRTPVVA